MSCFQIGFVAFHAGNLKSSKKLRGLHPSWNHQQPLLGSKEGSCRQKYGKGEDENIQMSVFLEKVHL